MSTPGQKIVLQMRNAADGRYGFISILGNSSRCVAGQWPAGGFISNLRWVVGKRDEPPAMSECLFTQLAWVKRPSFTWRRNFQLGKEKPPPKFGGVQYFWCQISQISSEHPSMGSTSFSCGGETHDIQPKRFTRKIDSEPGSSSHRQVIAGICYWMACIDLNRFGDLEFLLLPIIFDEIGDMEWALRNSKSIPSISGTRKWNISV